LDAVPVSSLGRQANSSWAFATSIPMLCIAPPK
jgi:hypothetical protein